MKAREVANILKTVPETEVDIITLVWRIRNERGEFDPTKISEYALEFGEASKRTKEYIRQTKRVNQCLISLAR